jgi:hypothetical protein
MRPCTRRIVPAEDVIKATSLDGVLGEHAPWCRTAPNALLIHTKPLAPFTDAAGPRAGSVMFSSAPSPTAMRAAPPLR